jgi:hypothetical protein
MITQDGNTKGLTPPFANKELQAHNMPAATSGEVVNGPTFEDGSAKADGTD